VNETKALPTPVWAANDSIVADCAGRGGTGNPKICKLDTSVLVRQYIRTLDVPMNNTLIMEVYKAFQHLTNVNSDEILGELSKSFAYIV